MIHMGATLPKNYIASEMPDFPLIWWELTTGLPKPFVKDGFAQIPEKPGLGTDLVEKAVRKRLPEGSNFFMTRGK